VRATDAAARMLRWLRSQFGSYFVAAAAYNGGPGRVTRALAQLASVADSGGAAAAEPVTGDARFFALAEQGGLRDETRNYVPQIIAATLVGREAERYGIRVRPLPPLAFDSVRVPGADAAVSGRRGHGELASGVAGPQPAPAARPHAARGRSSWYASRWAPPTGSPNGSRASRPRRARRSRWRTRRTERRARRSPTDWWCRVPCSTRTTRRSTRCAGEAGGDACYPSNRARPHGDRARLRARRRGAARRARCLASSRCPTRSSPAPPGAQGHRSAAPRSQPNGSPRPLTSRLPIPQRRRTPRAP
jgi:membrane-bound lytic murein transglycosylase D